MGEGIIKRLVSFQVMIFSPDLFPDQIDQSQGIEARIIDQQLDAEGTEGIRIGKKEQIGLKIFHHDEVFVNIRSLVNDLIRLLKIFIPDHSHRLPEGRAIKRGFPEGVRPEDFWEPDKTSHILPFKSCFFRFDAGGLHSGQVMPQSGMPVQMQIKGYRVLDARLFCNGSHDFDGIGLIRQLVSQGLGKI